MKRLRSQSGSTLVEAAIALPVLFMLLFGILEFGRAYNLHQVLTDAAREGARYSVAPYYGTTTLPSASDVQAQVQVFLTADNVQGATITVNQTSPVTVNGEPLVYTEVDVTAPYQFVYFPFGAINLTSRAVMRNETN